MIGGASPPRDVLTSEPVNARLRPHPYLWPILAAAALLASPGCKGGGGGGAAEGASLYAAACTRCHAESGKGGLRQPDGSFSRDLRSPEWQQSVTDEQLRNIIRNGRGKHMPAFADVLTIEKIDNIVAHIRTLRAEPAAPPAP